MNGYRNNNDKTRVGSSSFLHRVYACLEPYLVWNTLWILLFCVGLGYFLIAMPKYYDDFWFSLNLREWFRQQGVYDINQGGDIFRYGIPWKDVFVTWWQHICDDNSRLCNMIVVLFLLMPKWVGSSLALVSWMLAMWVSYRFAGINWKHSWLVVPALFLWSFCMPWSSHMGSLDYQFNYVLSSGIILGYAYWITTLDNPSVSVKILIVLVGVLVGSWHEGFSVPAFAGAVSCILFCRAFRRDAIYCGLAGIFIGICTFIISPSFINRINLEISHHQYVLYRLVRVLLGHPAYSVLILSLLFCVVNNKISAFARQPLGIFIIVSATVSMVIQFMVADARRAAWWADMISIVGIMCICRILFVNCKPGFKTINSWLSVIMMVLTIVHWGYVDYFVYKIKHQMPTVLSEHINGKKRVVFTDAVSFYDLPMICMNVPDAGILLSPGTMRAMNNYYHDGDIENYLTVIPESLRAVTETSGEEIEGGSGLRKVEGYLYSNQELQYYAKIIGKVKVGKIDCGDIEFYAYPYLSEGDGKMKTYLYPWHGHWKLLLGEITYVKLEEGGNNG